MLLFLFSALLVNINDVIIYKITNGIPFIVNSKLSLDIKYPLNLSSTTMQTKTNMIDISININLLNFLWKNFLDVILLYKELLFHIKSII